MAAMSTATTPKAPTRRTRLTADERREDVVAAAIREFAEQGYQAASTAAIARRAGISQPYIYALFPSKQDLFIAVHDHVMERIRQTFAEAAARGSTPDERLDRMGEMYPTLIADRYALLAQLQMYATGDPVIQAHASRRYRELYDDVGRMSGAPPLQVSLFFACGMLANVTTALGLEDICAPLFEAKLNGAPSSG
jgi:AcrR family transcriptional regulator